MPEPDNGLARALEVARILAQSVIAEEEARTGLNRELQELCAAGQRMSNAEGRALGPANEAYDGTLAPAREAATAWAEAFDTMSGIHEALRQRRQRSETEAVQ